MIVPSIVVPESISESLLYFPASVCGLGIGELYIPDTVVAIINIPEITVPDFSECPFYVPLPPPIFYASSAYPLYEVDQLNFTSTLMSAEFTSLPEVVTGGVNDSITFGSNFIFADLTTVITHTNFSTDTATLTSSLLTGKLKYPIPTENIETVSLDTNLVNVVLSNYRYLSTEIIPDAMYVDSLILSGSKQHYRYLSYDALDTDKISLNSTILSGSLD